VRLVRRRLRSHPTAGNWDQRNLLTLTFLLVVVVVFVVVSTCGCFTTSDLSKMASSAASMAETNKRNAMFLFASRQSFFFLSRCIVSAVDAGGGTNRLIVIESELARFLLFVILRC
jgi:hypothetical protein